MPQQQPPSAAAPVETKPARSGKKKLIWIGVIVISMVAGAVAPVAVGTHHLLGASPSKSAADREMASIPFGDVTVNLNDGRMSRYLRIKVVLLAETDDVKAITKQLEKNKPLLKDWLISHLSGKTLKDVGGTVGVKRIQREMQERFEELLFPEGQGKPFEVLFEEFVVQ